jgi:hypothetical protein
VGAASVFVGSFDILNLFSQFLDLGLDDQAGVFDCDLSGFGQHGIGLAI